MRRLRVLFATALLAGPLLAATPSATAATPAQVALAAYNRMNVHQRVGQLFMLGVTSTGATSAERSQLLAGAAGNVYLRTNTSIGVAGVRSVTASLRTTTTYAGVRPFIGTDQEGGQVQRLRGSGFSAIPTALAQGRTTLARQIADAGTWAGQMRSAGLNMDLAPVADVVPQNVGTANQAIGRYYREYGYVPHPAALHVTAVVHGFQRSGISATVKHFPGLGRATGNTDTTRNITDPTGPGSPYLEPFQRGIDAGARFVMVSSALYPKLDPGHLACFSSAIMKTLLRTKMGFTGIIVSDSFGATAPSAVPLAQRAVRFFLAGGTMVLDSAPGRFAAMQNGVFARMRTDAAFAATIKADVLKVLTAKTELGLIG